MSTYRDHRNRLLTAGFIAMALAGCGGAADWPKLAKVTGTLLSNGNPVPGATVVFVPKKGAASIGSTDKIGNFTLSYLKKHPGAVVDSHRVTVLLNQPGQPLLPGDAPRPLTGPPQEIVLPGTFDVEPGENTFELAIPLAKS